MKTLFLALIFTSSIQSQANDVLNTARLYEGAYQLKSCADEKTSKMTEFQIQALEGSETGSVRVLLTSKDGQTAIAFEFDRLGKKSDTFNMPTDDWACYKSKKTWNLTERSLERKSSDQRYRMCVVPEGDTYEYRQYRLDRKGDLLRWRYDAKIEEGVFSEDCVYTKIKN